ncbi:hypothetical protein B0H10DRAFT_2057022 [Mycena sp. CBHHK59/15]|nr:hypothetical protein B0H10DRAFT_2057022 [Mycena sp. CBHHK59/15]
MLNTARHAWYSKHANHLNSSRVTGKIAVGPHKWSTRPVIYIPVKRTRDAAPLGRRMHLHRSRVAPARTRTLTNRDAYLSQCVRFPRIGPLSRILDSSQASRCPGFLRDTRMDLETLGVPRDTTMMGVG